MLRETEPLLDVNILPLSSILFPWSGASSKGFSYLADRAEEVGGSGDNHDDDTCAG